MLRRGVLLRRSLGGLARRTWCGLAGLRGHDAVDLRAVAVRVGLDPGQDRLADHGGCGALAAARTLREERHGAGRVAELLADRHAHGAQLAEQDGDPGVVGRHAVPLLLADDAAVAQLLAGVRAIGELDLDRGPARLAVAGLAPHRLDDDRGPGALGRRGQRVAAAHL